MEKILEQLKSLPCNTEIKNTLLAKYRKCLIDGTNDKFCDSILLPFVTEYKENYLNIKQFLDEVDLEFSKIEVEKYKNYFPEYSLFISETITKTKYKIYGDALGFLDSLINKYNVEGFFLSIYSDTNHFINYWKSKNEAYLSFLSKDFKMIDSEVQRFTIQNQNFDEILEYYQQKVDKVLKRCPAFGNKINHFFQDFLSNYHSTKYSLLKKITYSKLQLYSKIELIFDNELEQYMKNSLSELEIKFNGYGIEKFLELDKLIQDKLKLICFKLPLLSYSSALNQIKNAYDSALNNNCEITDIQVKINANLDKFLQQIKKVEETLYMVSNKIEIIKRKYPKFVLILEKKLELLTIFLNNNLSQFDFINFSVGNNDLEKIDWIKTLDNINLEKIEKEFILLTNMIEDNQFFSKDFKIKLRNKVVLKIAESDDFYSSIVNIRKEMLGLEKNLEKLKLKDKAISDKVEFLQKCNRICYPFSQRTDVNSKVREISYEFSTNKIIAYDNYINRFFGFALESEVLIDQLQEYILAKLQDILRTPIYEGYSEYFAKEKKVEEKIELVLSYTHPAFGFSVRDKILEIFQVHKEGISFKKINEIRSLFLAKDINDILYDIVLRFGLEKFKDNVLCKNGTLFNQIWLENKKNVTNENNLKNILEDLLSHSFDSMCISYVREVNSICNIIKRIPKEEQEKITVFIQEKANEFMENYVFYKKDTCDKIIRELENFEKELCEKYPAKNLHSRSYDIQIDPELLGHLNQKKCLAKKSFSTLLSDPELLEQLNRILGSEKGIPYIPLLASRSEGTKEFEKLINNDIMTEKIIK